MLTMPCTRLDAETTDCQWRLKGRRFLAIGTLLTVSVPLASGAHAQRICFNEIELYLLDEQAESMASGLLNQDLAPDIAMLGSGRLDLFYNDGSGAYPEQQTITEGLSSARDIAIGDVNGDLAPDLVVANGLGNNASVFINDGTGQFGAPQLLAVGVRQTAVAVADLDGDLDNDLVFGAGHPQAGEVIVLLNNGDGTFGAPSYVPAVRSEEISGLTVGDLDNDGDREIVAATGWYSCILGQGDLAVLLNRGDGTFESGDRHTYDLMGFRAVTIAEVTGDLSPDLIVTATCDLVCVFPNRGDGTFGLASCFEFASGTVSRDVAAGDFDDDGDTDIAVAGGEYINSTFNGVSILFNDGNGFFSDRVMHPINVSLALVAGDLDGDGDDDLGVSTTGYYFSSDSHLAIMLNSCGDSDLTLEIQGTCPGPIDLVMTNVTPGGFVDLAFAFSTGTTQIPMGPCLGTFLDLGDPVRYAGSVQADANGHAVLSVSAPSVVCNATFLQAVDRTTCVPSNVAPL